MRAQILDWLKPTSEDPDTAHRQYLLNIILIALAVPGFIFGVVALILWLLDLSPVAGAIAGLAVQPFYLLSFYLGRRGHVRLAAYIPATVVFLIMAGSLFIVGIGHISIIGFAMVVVTAGILIGVGAASLFTLLSVVAYIAAGWAQNNGMITTALVPTETVLVDAIGLGLGLTVLVIFEWISNREMQRALKLERDLTSRLQVQSQELEQQVALRTQSLERKATQLETTSAIAKLATELLDPQDLMNRACEIIRSQFNLYHVSIFLLDQTGNWANLTASTGEAGRTMLVQHYRLAVGSASIIGWVTANRLPRVSQNVEEDTFFLPNPMLPETRSETTVPLIVGTRLLGALDVQSSESHPFSEDDVRTIEAIADELAISIDNARLLQETQQQLEKFESSYRELARHSWSRITRSAHETTIHVGGATDGDEDGVGFKTVDAATYRRETVLSDEKDEIAVPVQMRGEVIATIAAKKPEGSDSWSEEDIALLNAVARQIALSLESSRQYTEEHRRVAELEVINRVSQAVSQHLRLDSLYRVVHQQINQVLGPTDMYIALYDVDTEMISFPYVSENREIIKAEPVPYGEGLPSLIIRTRQPLLLQEDTERRVQALGAPTGERVAYSWLGVPLIIGDSVIGLIVVQDFEQEQRYSDDDAALLTTIASQVATALQNAQLMEQVQRTARRERLIHEITSKLRRAPDMKTILETTARELSRSLNVNRTSIQLHKEASTAESKSERSSDALAETSETESMDEEKLP
ncbi:MAG: GAF domain-containing protein [Anaerolineales bacterium]|nr:GAF domain-containing protein [Anaerolineales bacterium]